MSDLLGTLRHLKLTNDTLRIEKSELHVAAEKLCVTLEDHYCSKYEYGYKYCTSCEALTAFRDKYPKEKI